MPESLRVSVSRRLRWPTSSLSAFASPGLPRYDMHPNCVFPVARQSATSSPLFSFACFMYFVRLSKLSFLPRYLFPKITVLFHIQLFDLHSQQEHILLIKTDRGNRLPILGGKHLEIRPSYALGVGQNTNSFFHEGDPPEFVFCFSSQLPSSGPRSSGDVYRFAAAGASDLLKWCYLFTTKRAAKQNWAERTGTGLVDGKFSPSSYTEASMSENVPVILNSWVILRRLSGPKSC